MSNLMVHESKQGCKDRSSAHQRKVKVSKDLLLLRCEDARRPWQREDRPKTSELLVKVADVSGRPDDRQEGRFDPLC